MFERLTSSRLMIVIRGLNLKEASDLCYLLYENGVHFAEVSFSDESSGELLRNLKTSFGGRLFLGAGTVFRESTYSEAVRSNADFVLSPGLSSDIAELSRRDGVPYIPGVYTATDIQNSLEMGYSLLKLFPAGAERGIDLVKAYSGPFPEAKFMAFGGITVSNAGSYIKSGAVALGIGSFIANSKLLSEKNYKELEERILSLKKAVGEIDV
jgi:Entner-Doudoroff aldolase